VGHSSSPSEWRPLPRLGPAVWRHQWDPLRAAALQLEWEMHMLAPYAFRCPCQPSIRMWFQISLFPRYVSQGLLQSL
jgi:hypothetical protein